MRSNCSQLCCLTLPGGIIVRLQSVVREPRYLQMLDNSSYNRLEWAEPLPCPSPGLLGSIWCQQGCFDGSDYVTTDCHSDTHHITPHHITPHHTDQSQACLSLFRCGQECSVTYQAFWNFDQLCDEQQIILLGVMRDEGCELVG